MPEIKISNLLVSLYDLLGWALLELGLSASLVSIVQKFIAAFALANFCLLTPFLIF